MTSRRYFPPGTLGWAGAKSGTPGITKDAFVRTARGDFTQEKRRQAY